MGEVWPLIGEAHRWKEWTFLTRSEVELPGDPPPDGVGAVRRVHQVRDRIARQQVVAWDPPRRLGLRRRAGASPVRRYRADVHLAPDGTGTTVTWAATFDELVPATGRLMSAVLTRMISRFASGAAAYAGKLHEEAG